MERRGSVREVEREWEEEETREGERERKSGRLLREFGSEPDAVAARVSGGSTGTRPVHTEMRARANTRNGRRAMHHPAANY